MPGGRPTIAILGGTGDLGSGLGLQLARAGYPVTIGSRTAEKADRAVDALRDKAPDARLHAAENPDAAAGADIVIMTVPFASHRATLESVRDAVQGKIFVDATVPLVPPKVMRVQLPPGGSAARQAQDCLGDGVRVVSAFQNVAAGHLQKGDLADADCDVLVCGNDPQARQAVIELAEAMGLRAWHGGPIDNSAVAEALTSVLIFMNRRYNLHDAGIRFTGKPKS